MNDKKKIAKILLMAVGGLLIIGALFVFIFGAGKSEGFKKVLQIIIGILMIADGGLLLTIVVMKSAEAPNFFLYDRATERNIDVRDLTFQQVNARMSMYMRQISESGRQIWDENIIGSDREELGEGGFFKPLVAYKMLYDLTVVENEDIWMLFTTSNPEVVKSLSDALTMNGDSEMGSTLIYLRENCAGDTEKPKEFITSNQKYIQSKMLKYVKANIEKFVA